MTKDAHSDRVVLAACDLLLAARSREHDVGTERGKRIGQAINTVQSDHREVLAALAMICADLIVTLTATFAEGTLEPDAMIWMLVERAMDR